MTKPFFKPTSPLDWPDDSEGYEITDKQTLLNSDLRRQIRKGEINYQQALKLGLKEEEPMGLSDLEY